METKWTFDRFRDRNAAPLANGASQQFGRRDAVEALKMVVVALGVIVFGYFAATLAQYSFPQPNAASAIVIERGNAENGPASEVPDPHLSPSVMSASEPRAKTQSVSDLPRECDLRRGIDADCLFN